MVKKLLAKLRRFNDFKICKHILYKKVLRKYKRYCTECFLKELTSKKILMMRASTIMNTMLQQRPHHFVNYWKKDFDIVLYISYRVDSPKLWKDNIYEVPSLPIIKQNDNEIYYYMSSVSCVPLKDLKKMKKYNYKIIYDYYDEISADISSPKNALKVHKNLGKLDPNLVIATSNKLYNDVNNKGLSNLILVKNGVTIEDFNKEVSTPPQDMKQIIENKLPVVGYYGYLANWTDLDLIEKSLIKFPNYNFVFIGKTINNLNIDYLKKYKNFYYLGHKNYYDLYKYSSYFNCALIPFKHGRIAKATSPNKLYEYMAVGLPVVCTRDLVECKGYDGVLMSEDDEEFMQNIVKAIELSKDIKVKSALKKYAAENSWEKKADIILEKIKEL